MTTCDAIRGDKVGIKSTIEFPCCGMGFARFDNLKELEQLERLLSENTPRCPTITHTIDSNQIPNENKTKSKLQIWKICQNF